MRSLVFRFVTVGGALALAFGACGEVPTAPASPGEIAGSNSSSAQTSAVIRSDIAAATGNAIASDIASLVVSQVSPGAFSIAGSSFHQSSFGDTPSEEPNCVKGPEEGIFLCKKEPGEADHLACEYSEERKLFVCRKPDEPEKVEPKKEEPKKGDDPKDGESESCSFAAATQRYTCSWSEEGFTTVRSHQFRDAAGQPMSGFVRGVTASIHYLVKTDGSVSKDTSYRRVVHSLRDQTVSGLLGDNKVWNGIGASADTNSHREGSSSRTYTGLAVDTVKAVTFAGERADHPYPISGVAVRVVNYTVVSTGKQTETLTVSKRVVVTFNGTADVPISLGDYSCVLHLDTRKVDGCR